MKKTLTFLLIVLSFSACKKSASNISQDITSGAKIYAIYDGHPDKIDFPAINLEITDSTFYNNSVFNYAIIFMADSLTVGYPMCFTPLNLVLKNPAFLSYDFSPTEDLTGVLPYKMAYSPSSVGQQVNLKDTSRWIPIPILDYNPAEKIIKFPVTDFAHAYFMGKKP